MDRGAWQATVHGVAKSQTQISNFTFTLTNLNFKINYPFYYWKTWSNLGMSIYFSTVKFLSIYIPNVSNEN